MKIHILYVVSKKFPVCFVFQTKLENTSISQKITDCRSHRSANVPHAILYSSILYKNNWTLFIQVSFKEGGKLFLKVKNFYCNGNAFCKVFLGVSSSHLFFETWECRTRYNTGNIKQCTYTNYNTIHKLCV